MTRYSPAFSIWTFDYCACGRCKTQRIKRCALVSDISLESISADQLETETAENGINSNESANDCKDVQTAVRSETLGPAIRVTWLCMQCINKVLREFSPNFHWAYAWRLISEGTPAVVHFDNPQMKEKFEDDFAQFSNPTVT